MSLNFWNLIRPIGRALTSDLSSTQCFYSNYRSFKSLTQTNSLLRSEVQFKYKTCFRSYVFCIHVSGRFYENIQKIHRILVTALGVFSSKDKSINRRTLLCLNHECAVTYISSLRNHIFQEYMIYGYRFLLSCSNFVEFWGLVHLHKAY